MEPRSAAHIRDKHRHHARDSGTERLASESGAVCPQHDEHDQARFARRIRKSFQTQSVSFPTAEDVIVWTLRWGRSKDLDDVRNVILVQERESTLDWPYIRGWCEKHGTTQRLDDILASLPKRGR